MNFESEFAHHLIQWQKNHGRHHLPWQVRNPYQIWLSEIMLQQTQVATVLDYYPRFLQTFPDVEHLAAASQDEVLALWAGLGYYSRARNLHQAARQIVDDFGGVFPSSRQELEKLCGVGRSTAAAIAAFAFHQRESILDGNVKRVLARVFAFEGVVNQKAGENELWQLAERLLPQETHDMPAYTQGLMDLGATICKPKKPNCTACPMQHACLAYQHHRIDELPKKKSAIPVQKQTIFFLHWQRADGAVYIEQRPQTGIWAGLYCLPAFDSMQQLHDWLQQHHLKGKLLEKTAISHRLTHRLLEMLPVCLDEEYTVECTLSGKWIHAWQQDDFALPKPLKTYLQTNAWQ